MRIRFDMPVDVDVIRLAFWVIEVMLSYLQTIVGLVVLFPSQPGLGILWFKLFAKLHQTINQPAPASDYMQAALVLMVLENFVQAAFQWIHHCTPSAGFQIP